MKINYEYDGISGFEGSQQNQGLCNQMESMQLLSLHTLNVDYFCFSEYSHEHRLKNLSSPSKIYVERESEREKNRKTEKKEKKREKDNQGILSIY